MNLKRKVGMLAAVAVAAAGLPLLATDVAMGAVAAGGGNAIQTVGSCGGFLREKEASFPGLVITILVPDPSPNDSWSLVAQQQDYDATTGGAVGNPVDLVANHTLPPMVFNNVEGGFTTTGQVTDQTGLTHGFSFTATRAADGLVCTGQAFWTTPANSLGPVVPPNPDGKPETAAKPTGATEADAGTNDALVQFDQGLLDSGAGIPANGQFTIQVDGVARTVTGVTIINDNPPAQSIVDVSFGGAPLVSGQTVSESYRKPLSSTAPHLQDLNGNPVASYGPLSIPVF